MPEKRAMPLEGEHFERIPGNYKKVRCILVGEDGKPCGLEIASPEENVTRCLRHYSWEKSASGKYGGARKCMAISEEERKNFCDADLRDEQFQPIQPGFKPLMATRTKPFLAFYTANADGTRVMCRYCSDEGPYHEERMLSHLIHGTIADGRCTVIDPKIRESLENHKPRKHLRVEMALRHYVHARMASGVSQNDMISEYTSPAFTQLIADLVRIPGMSSFTMPPPGNIFQ